MPISARISPALRARWPCCRDATLAPAAALMLWNSDRRTCARVHAKSASCDQNTSNTQVGAIKVAEASDYPDGATRVA